MVRPKNEDNLNQDQKVVETNAENNSENNNMVNLFNQYNPNKLNFASVNPSNIIKLREVYYYFYEGFYDK